MARQIVAVYMSGGSQHEHITGVVYVVTDTDNWSPQYAKLETVLSEMASRSDFFTRDWDGEVAQVVAVGSGSSRYIRTKRDGLLRDNLLRLPRLKDDR